MKVKNTHLLISFLLFSLLSYGMKKILDALFTKKSLPFLVITQNVQILKLNAVTRDFGGSAPDVYDSSSIRQAGYHFLQYKEDKKISGNNK